MKLSIAPRLEQQQILAPQMILSMDILLLNSIDLENRIEKEFMENPALELEESPLQEAAPKDEKPDPEIQQIYDTIDEYMRRYGGDEPAPKKGAAPEVDSKYEALANTADRPMSLVEHLRTQLRFKDLDSVLLHICENLAGEIDQRGYLLGTVEEISSSLGVSELLAERAIQEIQALDPIGVGARDLRECLLIQLASHPQCLEYKIIDQHLKALLENRLPRIAEQMGIGLDEVKSAKDMIAMLDPQPGSRFDYSRDGIAIPEIFVDEVGDKFKVRVDEKGLPQLRLSPALGVMLNEGGQDAAVRDFIKNKLEAARWLLHAIDQRRRTVFDIAECIVKHQEEFFRKGPGHLNALTMQVVADEVGVHISTVSRATNGKFIQTPYGVMDLRRFFTGGVERADGGGIESRDNVCQLITEIVASEDTRKPLSDSQLAKALQERGIEIARRTVSKYRERAGIGQARLRKQY